MFATILSAIVVIVIVTIILVALLQYSRNQIQSWRWLCIKG